MKNETRVIDTSIDKLKRIYHISDIQIRNLKRHKEFELVFNKLYEEIKKQPEDSVVYIGGDIAHSKTEMSPELVDQLSRLFKNLSDIVPTIIIAGNHDCNLNNQHRLDVLTPIVENLNHPNLYYFKDSGVYKFADVSFVGTITIDPTLSSVAYIRLYPLLVSSNAIPRMDCVTFAPETTSMLLPSYRARLIFFSFISLQYIYLPALLSIRSAWGLNLCSLRSECITIGSVYPSLRRTL